MPKQIIKDYSLIYIAKWQIQGFEDYYFTTTKKLYNKRTNRFSKKRVKNYSVGYTLNGSFYTLQKMEKLTTLIRSQSFKLTNKESVKQLYNYLLTAA